MLQRKKSLLQAMSGQVLTTDVGAGDRANY